MTNENSRELVGVLLLNVVPTAHLLRVRITRTMTKVVDYTVSKTDHYDLKCAARMTCQAYRPAVCGLWFSKRFVAYFVQMQAHRLPEELWPQGMWVHVDLPLS